MPLSQPLPHSEEMEMTVGRNPAMTPEDITSPALVSCQLLKPTDGFLLFFFSFSSSSLFSSPVSCQGVCYNHMSIITVFYFLSFALLQHWSAELFILPLEQNPAQSFSLSSQALSISVTGKLPEFHSLTQCL